MAIIKIELRKYSYEGSVPLSVMIEDYKKALQLVKDKIHCRDFSGKDNFHEEEHILEIVWNTEIDPGVPKR